jgi:hypothetical protein
VAIRPKGGNKIGYDKDKEDTLSCGRPFGFENTDLLRVSGFRQQIAAIRIF